MFNSLVEEEGTVKIVDGSACKIDIGVVNAKGKDGTMLTLEAVR